MNETTTHGVTPIERGERPIDPGVDSATSI